MGWLFNYVDHGKPAFISSLVRNFGTNYTHIKHRVVGNHVWHLVRNNRTGETHISLDLIAKEKNGGWGNKGMSESAGPYYYDCPLSLLNEASETTNEHALAWREKVRKHHAAKAAKPVAKPGMVVKFGDCEYRLTAPAGPRLGWAVQRVPDGAGFRMTAAQLSRALTQGATP